MGMIKKYILPVFEDNIGGEIVCFGFGRLSVNIKSIKNEIKIL